VKRYREDKPASEADSIGFVRELYERSIGAGADANAAPEAHADESDPDPKVT
jgi:hypothetical protein